MNCVCRVTVTKQIEACEVYSTKNTDEAMFCAADHAVNAAGYSMVRAKDGDPGASSVNLYSSNEVGWEAGGGSNAGECYLPVYHQKKAKLLCMQEEVGFKHTPTISICFNDL